jgi:hypothetical protein
MTAAFSNVVTSLEASFFGAMGAVSVLLGLLVWIDAFGPCRRASAAGLFVAACLSLRSLKGLAVSFGSDFLSGDVDQAPALLAAAVVLVSSGGAPDLVVLGSVAWMVFRQFFLKTAPGWFFLLGFPYKPRHVCILFVSVFGQFPFKLVISLLLNEKAVLLLVAPKKNS